MKPEVILNAVNPMRHGRIRNYIAPGLTSWLIGGSGHGMVRLFSSDRDTHELIVPHSHRFDFTCVVLRGKVTQVLYLETGRADQGNAYAVGKLKTQPGGFGRYDFEPGKKPEYFSETEYEYLAGDTYRMRRHEIHSIRFSRGAEVLFLEGPEMASESKVLEPWSDGRRVPTFVTHPWMFDRNPDPGVTITAVSEE